MTSDIPFVIEEGDLIQARKVTPQGIIPLEFLVTGVAEGVVSGSPLGDLDPDDGWKFELCRKGDPGLPESLSDLAVWTVTDRTTPLRIVGPIAGVWQIAGGRSIPASDILAWMPWGDWTPPAEPVYEDDEGSDPADALN